MIPGKTLLVTILSLHPHSKTVYLYPDVIIIILQSRRRCLHLTTHVNCFRLKYGVSRRPVRNSQ